MHKKPNSGMKLKFNLGLQHVLNHGHYLNHKLLWWVMCVKKQQYSDVASFLTVARQLHILPYATEKLGSSMAFSNTRSMTPLRRSSVSMVRSVTCFISWLNICGVSLLRILRTFRKSSYRTHVKSVLLRPSDRFIPQTANVKYMFPPQQHATAE